MRRVIRRVHLAASPEEAWRACLDLLRRPDPARGVIERTCRPDPPVVGSVVTSTIRAGGNERELRAEVVELLPPHALATAAEGPGPAVRTSISLDPAAGGGTHVTLVSETESGFPVGGRAGRLLDELLLGGPQRRSARASLRRLGELASG
jgi:hypothetical protein